MSPSDVSLMMDRALTGYIFKQGRSHPANVQPWMLQLLDLSIGELLVLATPAVGPWDDQSLGGAAAAKRAPHSGKASLKRWGTS